VRRHQVRLAAFQRLRDTQQSDKVRVISVEELPRVGAIDAHAVDGAGVLAEILDVPENVAMSVLRDEVAEVGSKALCSASASTGAVAEGWCVPCMPQRSCGCPIPAPASP
jgi:hypothetical protein